MSARPHELQLLDLFRTHFFGSRRSSRVDHSEISPNQAFVLSELVRRESPSLDELSSVLKVHVSSLSRAISHLEKVGMVSSERDPVDARRKRVRPTSKGIAIAKMSWVSQQTVIERRLKGFLSVERDALQSFLRVLVGDDAYGRIKPVPSEPEMAIISRAMTYDHGVVSDNYLESGYSVLDWIILSEIRYHARPARQLTILTRSSPSAISLRLKSLVSKRLLSSTPGTHDRRERSLRLTKRGESALETIENSATLYFARTLRILSPRQIEEGLALFRRYCDELRPDFDLELSLEPVRLESYDSLRRRLLVSLVSLGDSYPCGPTLVKPGNSIVLFGAEPSNQVVCECEPQPDGDYRVVNVIPLSEKTLLPPSLAIISALERHLGGRLRIPREIVSFIDSRSRERLS